jgi:hypothetical protein
MRKDVEEVVAYYQEICRDSPGGVEEKSKAPQ